MNKNQFGFSLIVIIVGTVLICTIAILGYRISKSHQSKSNQKYFSQLARTVQTYYENQANALGLEASDQNPKKVCYQSGQGPFDDGHLRCGIKIIRKIQVEPSNTIVSDMLSKFVVSLKQDKFVIVGGSEKISSNGASLSAGIYEEDLHCTTHISYSPNSLYSAAKTTLDYDLECSKDASQVPTGFTYTPLR